MRIDEIHSKISEIAKIEDPKKVKEAVIDLNKELNEPKKKIVSRGNWTYFYTYTIEYDSTFKRTRETNLENIGKLPRKHYESNKEEINNFRFEQLKKYLDKKE